MLNSSLGAYPEHRAPPSPPPGAPGTDAADKSYGGEDEGDGSAGQQLPPRLVPEEPMYLIISVTLPSYHP